MTADMDRLVTWHNGEKTPGPFSAAEMDARQTRLRAHLAEHGLDAALLTSYHNICYFSGFLYCAFGRKYGLVVTADEAQDTVTAKYVGKGGKEFGKTAGWDDLDAIRPVAEDAQEEERAKQEEEERAQHAKKEGRRSIFWFGGLAWYVGLGVPATVLLAEPGASGRLRKLSGLCLYRRQAEMPRLLLRF